MDIMNPRYTVLEAGSLQISDSEEEDQGKYECVAENVVGTEYSVPTTLYVKVRRVPPQFSIPPRPLHEVMLGADLNVTCVAVGSPMPLVKWRLTAGPELTPEDQIPIGQPGTAPRNVQVRPLSSSTMVIQWDEPETPNGQVTGYKVYYTTNPGQAMASWESQMVDNNQLTTISDLTPHTIYTIRVQAFTSVGPGPLSAPGYKVYYTTNPGQAMASWESQMVDNNQLTTISDLTPHTIYTIRVQAFTSVGPGPLSAPVQVKTQQGVPSQPGNLRATDVGETSVTLQWTRPAHSSENIVMVETYTLTDLYPNTLYYVWIAARSQRGEGATTSPTPIRTKQYVPGAPPQNLSAVPEGSAAIRVRWNPPPAEHQNGRILYYRIQVVESARPDSEAIVIKLNASATTFLVDELKKWTEYRIWVLAGTSVGDGPPSNPVSVRTDEDVPGDPQDVRVNPLNSTSVRVDWKPPLDKDRNGLIRGYHVHVQEMRE
ncbi:hypothetical protein B566_EDAN018067, partial [Ephemera danica]